MRAADPATFATCAPPAERRVNVVQGEFHVSNCPATILTTLLGSCVAACLYDPSSSIGGMNHFLLPGGSARDNDRDGGLAMRHGVHAMELLVNDLLQRGARREQLRAKLFGGARMLQGLTDIGCQNADFAERFVRRERITLTGGSLRGDRGRRVQFWPATGRARQITIDGADAGVFATERRDCRPVQDSGALELF